MNYGVLKKTISLVLLLASDMNNLNKTVIIFLASLAVLVADSVPAPPAIPELQIVSGNEEIKLIWDDKAEDSIDPLTGYSDFEGYRIYRSTDGGQTWGDSWDRIYDYSGNPVAWKPYAQFDLVEESDSLHCIYKNGYKEQVESGELCYSNALSYDSLLSVAPYLLDDSGVIINDFLVYLPDYKRGNCHLGYAHIEHDWDQSHYANDCFNAGLVSEFDPMAAWINLGDNVGIKRSFVDTDVLQYTYAVTAFDIGMKSFNVDFLSTASGIANEKCDVNDLLTLEQEIRLLLEIEGYCESLPSCEWSDDDVCKYSDVNYCSGNDSYCDGMECCAAGGCCNNDVNGIVNLNKNNCNLLSSFDNHIWLPEIYTDEAACDGAGFIWKDVDHGFEDYSYSELCEDAGHDWIVVEYLNNDSCVARDYEWKIINFLPDTTWSSWNPGHFTGLKYGDDLWGYPSFESPKLYESFTDYNVNGICDNEPFTDADSSDTNDNGICDGSGDWTMRCPDILENCTNDTNSDGIIDGDDNNCCINVVVIDECFGHGIDEGFCDCDNNLDTCELCPTIDPDGYGGVCTTSLGYALTGQGCESITGCGYGEDESLFYSSIEECHSDNEDCQNCKVLDLEGYGSCEMVLGWGWTGEVCELISGCGEGDDEPWFYDNHQVCMTRCSYGYNPGCTNETACNYDETATEDDGSCIYAEQGFDCDGNQLSLFNGLIPEDFSIHSIYPNPFNPITNITYGIPEYTNVQIIVYDLSGKQVETLINQFKTPGYHSVNWDASSYPSGIYLIRMVSSDFTQTQKVVLVK